MDDTIDEKDIAYVEGVIKGTNEATNLSDANCDGKVDEKDIDQIKLIMDGEESELIIVDSYNRTITVKEPVERIVSFYAPNVETMRSMKATDKIVGVTESAVENDIYYPEFDNSSSVGLDPSHGDPDIEKVVELKPDIVLSNTYSKNGVALIDLIKSANPDIEVILLDCYKPETYLEETKKLGYILGKNKEANEFGKFYSDIMNTIAERVETIPYEQRPKIYFEYTTPYLSCGKSSAYAQKAEAAGGRNIFAYLDVEASSKVDPEAVITLDPDIIIKLSPTDKAGYEVDDSDQIAGIWEEIVNRPELQNISAIKNQRVYVITYPVLSDKHFVGIAYLAKWFHPDLFLDLDPQAIHQEYLTRFQGLDFDVSKHGIFVYNPELYPDGR
jgi:iron complex transport system substrate-binding protein